MKKIRDINWVLKNYWDFFQKYGMQQEQIIEKFKTYSSAGDFVWAIFQRLLIEVAEAFSKGEILEEQFYRENRDIYFKMCYFLRKHEKKKGNEILQSAFYNELLYYRISTSLKFNVAILSGACCPFCDSLNHKEMAFEEALKEQYLGSDACTRENGCNCTYTNRPLRDSNGRLIKI